MSNAYVTDCDYCGEIALVTEDGYGGKACRCCLNRIEENDRKAESDDDFDFVDEEYDPETHDEEGNVRPYMDAYYDDYDFRRDNWPE